MSKDIIYFAENVCGLNLTETQKEILRVVQNSNDRGEKVFLSYGRKQGIGLLKNILYGFETWLKDQRIAELEEQLKNAIVPKFKTYQQVYTISKFYTPTNGIPEYEIFNSYYYVAENENEIIVGWNYEKDFNQRKYYYIKKDWVFATKEEAEAKLEELKGNNYE